MTDSDAPRAKDTARPRSTFIRHVGFTGTREGMTHRQMQYLYSLLIDFQNASIGQNFPISFHHGDCIGADAEANAIATALDYFTHSHPPQVPDKRAFCKSDQIWLPEEYMKRNANIVSASDVLLVAPRTSQEQRSGTWATYRMARKQDIPALIMNP